MRSLDSVRDHFDRDAERFDSIYEEEKPLFHRIVDRFRKVVVERFELVCTLAPLPGSWSVLDIGCGPGRYGQALAKLGAKRIVGLDVAGKMVELAEREAENAGCGGISEFVHTDFLGWDSEERFEVVLAMGYYDYLEHPIPHLKKMVERCQGRIFASIPKRGEWRVPIRKVRFLLARSFVRFYSRSEAEELIREAEIAPERAYLIDLGRDWLLVVNCVE